eukprot:TRINITY_DN66425_c7_g2_i1.p1 TRINITY_DN66425_c7_g2~~TRINITY_DN66425_c7_g2_i1.p1  ORF type:complete len:680 (-),score=77.87 TRINITY_DN66425_c7_g2_i1:780-2777(-)
MDKDEDYERELQIREQQYLTLRKQVSDSHLSLLALLKQFGDGEAQTRWLKLEGRVKTNLRRTEECLTLGSLGTPRSGSDRMSAAFPLPVTGDEELIEQIELLQQEKSDMEAHTKKITADLVRAQTTEKRLIVENAELTERLKQAQSQSHSHSQWCTELVTYKRRAEIAEEKVLALQDEIGNLHAELMRARPNSLELGLSTNKENQEEEEGIEEDEDEDDSDDEPTTQPDCTTTNTTTPTPIPTGLAVASINPTTDPLPSPTDGEGSVAVKGCKVTVPRLQLGSMLQGSIPVAINATPHQTTPTSATKPVIPRLSLGALAASSTTTTSQVPSTPSQDSVSLATSSRASLGSNTEREEYDKKKILGQLQELKDQLMRQEKLVQREMQVAMGQTTPELSPRQSSGATTPNKLWNPASTGKEQLQHSLWSPNAPIPGPNPVPPQLHPNATATTPQTTTATADTTPQSSTTNTTLSMAKQATTTVPKHTQMSSHPPIKSSSGTSDVAVSLLTGQTYNHTSRSVPLSPPVERTPMTARPSYKLSPSPQTVMSPPTRRTSIGSLPPQSPSTHHIQHSHVTPSTPTNGTTCPSPRSLASSAIIEKGRPRTGAHTARAWHAAPGSSPTHTTRGSVIRPRTSTIRKAAHHAPPPADSTEGKTTKRVKKRGSFGSG